MLRVSRRLPSKPGRQMPIAPSARKLVLAVAVCLSSLPAFGAVTPDDIRQAAQDVLSSARFQTELPADAEPTPTTQIDQERRWRLDLPEGLSGIARLLMWVLVAAGGVLLAIFLINEIGTYRLRTRDGRRTNDVSSADGQAAESRGGNGASLAEADRLAAEGRYSEAVHMLLLDCLAQLRRLRFESTIVPSLTSREVLGRLTLSERAAGALSAIVSAVELSHFGGRVPGESDYLACRQNYLSVADENAGAA